MAQRTTTLGLPEGGRLSQPLDLSSLQTLLKLKAGSNMSPTGDAFLDKRTAQINSGDDEYAPSELEQLQAQAGLGEQGLGVSREMIRDSGIAKLKQTLGIQAQKAQQEMAAKIVPEQIRGEYSVRAARERGQEASSRQQYGQEQINKRQEDQQAAILERLNQTLGAQGTRQEDAQAAALERDKSRVGQKPLPAALLKGVDEARQSYEGIGNNPLTRLFQGNSKERNYRSQLEVALSQKGVLPELQQQATALKGMPGATVEEKAAAAGFSADGLDPYERAWLSLTLGVK